MKCQIFLFCLVLFLSLVKQFISLPFSFSFIIVSLFASLVSSPHFIYLYMFSFSIIFFPFNLSKYFIHTTSTWRTTKWCSQNHSYSLFFLSFLEGKWLTTFFSSYWAFSPASFLWVFDLPCSISLRVYPSSWNKMPQETKINECLLHLKQSSTFAIDYEREMCVVAACFEKLCVFFGFFSLVDVVSVDIIRCCC